MHANPVSLPDGVYVSVANAIRLNKGGRTAVLLMRANALADAGARSVIATVADVPELPETRAEMVGRGQLSPSVEVVNVFADYRDRDRARLGTGSGDPLTAPDGLVATVETHADGTPYRTTWRPSGAPTSSEPTFTDHQRADGSVFVRWSDGPTVRIELLDHDERVIARHRGRARFLRAWLRDLVGQDDAFLITDSRRMVPTLLGLTEPRMHLVAAFHNPHIERDGRWDGPLKGPYTPVIDHLTELDGLVLLTERQRDEIALRCGGTDNLFVVPNPVSPPRLPEPLPVRDPKRLVVVARLEGQKRVAHALRAVARARETDPGLHLDVYGDGLGRPGLEKLADELGIAPAVTFHGYDPAARDSLLTASAFLVTSKHEGYPLATLEAMSRGCPVISYDIKFGPREQIEDGVDGFLVEDGDVAEFADRILLVTSDPERLSAMSAAALAKAAEHSPQRFREDWVRVFRTIKEQEAGRVQIRSGHLHGGSVVDGRFTGRLRLRIGGPRPATKGLTATVDVIGETTGEVISFPVAVKAPVLGPRVGAFRLDGSVDAAGITEALGEQPLRVRLTAVLRNASWQAPLGSGTVSGGRLQLGPHGPAAG